MENINKIIDKFIDIRGYKNNPHVLGVFFYGSYLAGFANENSDIDLHIVFDNKDPQHLVRGNMIVDGKRVEYFEKPINYIYKSARQDFLKRQNALLSIIGKSQIVYYKDEKGLEKLTGLQKRIVSIYSKNLPKLEENIFLERESIMDNRIEKMRTIDDPAEFERLYQLTIEKIRRLHHDKVGLSTINTTKVYKVYNGTEQYRNAYCKKLPEKEFLDLYNRAIKAYRLNKKQKMKRLEELYKYVIGEQRLPENYQINIDSRLVKKIW